MCAFIYLLIITCSPLIGLGSCTSSYDQRQTGDLNVQIGLKNIQLIALLKAGKEEYVDYDYAYDYSEMTIKPQNGTTPKPLNVTVSQTQGNVSSPLVALADNETDTNVDTISENRINATDHSTNATPQFFNGSEDSNSTIEATNATTDIIDIKSQIANPSTYTNNKQVEADVAPTLLEYPSDANVTPTVSASHCRRGFVQNNEGKCEYKVHGTTNALRRIVKLAQKIKIGRGYTET